MVSINLSLVMEKADEKPFNVSKVLYESRYCNQDDFNILVCGGKHEKKGYSNDVYQLKIPKFKFSKFSNVSVARYNCKIVGVNSDFVVVGGYNTAGTRLYSIILFKTNEKSWFYKTELPDKRNGFCICFFKQKLFIIGGRSYQTLNSCFVYKINGTEWSQIANMIEERENAACAVFEGKIIVCGGIGMKSVETYDYYKNKWTYLPDMIEHRSEHSSISTGNKLFAVGGALRDSWEVFDSVTRRFSIFRNVIKFTSDHQGACCVGEKIILVAVSMSGKNELVLYDVRKNTFSSKTF